MNTQTWELCEGNIVNKTIALQKMDEYQKSFDDYDFRIVHASRSLVTCQIEGYVIEQRQK